MSYSSAARLFLIVGAISIACSSLIAAQSFTSNRLQAGTSALDVGNFDQATIELELAAIGLLDDPGEYVHCKTLLFLAQVGARQRSRALATLHLIARLEQQSETYSSAPIPAERRHEFEQTVNAQFGKEPFTQTPRFGELMRTARELAQPQIDETTLSVSELKSRLNSNPLDPRLLESLAIRHYRNRKPADAQRTAERLLAVEPNNVNGLCIQATAGAARNRSLCSGYLPTLSACPGELQTPFYVNARLRCYLEIDAFDAGVSYLDELQPADVASAGAEGLARKIRNKAGAQEILTANTAVAADATQSPDTVDADTVADAGSGAAETATDADPENVEAHNTAVLDQDVADRLATLDQDGADAFAAADRERLAAVLDEAVRIADTHPLAIEPKQVAGKFAYLLSDWVTCAHYLEQARQLGAITASQGFYLAVSHFEMEDLESARAALLESLENGLNRSSEIVKAYEGRILGTEP